MSTVADLLLGLGQVVMDRLAADDLRPAGSPHLYVGVPPADCCPAVGMPADIYTWWERIAAPDARGGPNEGSFSGCAPTALIQARILARVCWPVPDDPAAIDYTAYDPIARWVVEAAWSGEQALRDLVCQTRSSDLLGRWGVRRWWAFAAQPGRPQGGCVGVTWSMVVAPSGDWPPGSVLPAP